MFNRIPVITKILIGFAIAIAGIGYFSIVTYKDTNENIKETAIVNNNISFIACLERVLFHMQYFENSNRDYITTKEERHLDDYYSGVAKLEAEIRSIEQLTKNDPAKKDFVDSLRLLSNKKISLSQNTISLFRENKPDEAIELLNSADNKLLVESLRKYVRRMESKLITDLNESAEKKEFSAIQTRTNFSTPVLHNSHCTYCFLYNYFFGFAEERKSKN